MIFLDAQLKQSISGAKVDIETWRYCNESLIDKELQYEIKRSQPLSASIRSRKDLKDQLKETKKLSIIKFPEWGHTMHLKWLPGHKNWLSNEEDINFLNSLI